MALSRRQVADNVRPPAVAGLFYSAEAAILAGEVDRCLAEAGDAHGLAANPLPKAVIAPHAGYVYSGPIAGTAYAPFVGRGESVSRVVLLGPSHRLAFRGLAVSGADSFLTPLGSVPVDKAAVAAALELPQVRLLEEAHAMEHSLEVHLPFLQRIFPSFAVVPVVVGEAAPEQVDTLLKALWGGPETVIVVSSDLSHYHDFETARGLDADASRAIESLRPDLLRGEQACGRRPIRGLLARARALDLRVTTVDLRNSGDTAGPKDQVVGYGAYLFEHASTARLPEPCRRLLLETAAKTVRHGARHGRPSEIETEGLPQPVQAVRACFVTIKLDGELRGCIGSMSAQRPLIQDVATNAYSAAFADPRFSAVTPAEAERLEVGISILSTPRPVPQRSEADLVDALCPGTDGLILVDGDKRALFLPQVWEGLPERREFVSRLKQKAGLAPDHWSERLEALRFSAESFSSPPPGALAS